MGQEIEIPQPKIEVKQKTTKIDLDDYLPKKLAAGEVLRRANMNVISSVVNYVLAILIFGGAFWGIVGYIGVVGAFCFNGYILFMAKKDVTYLKKNYGL